MIKEKIFLVPNCNEVEVLREQAKNGVNSFNTRILSTNDFLEKMLLTKGINYNYEIISDDDAVLKIADLLLNQNKCPNLKINNYEDCKNIYNSLSLYRKLLVGDDEEKLFIETLKIENSKNGNLKELYKEYKKVLEKESLKDNIDYIRDVIKLYRNNTNDGMKGVEFYKFKEFILSPLEEEMLNLASEGKYDVISISDLYVNKNNESSSVSYSSGYGITSEVKSIIDYIYKNKIPLDECVIASTNYSIYAQQFLEYITQYNINATFSDGLLITNTYPATFLKLLLNWKKNKFNFDSMQALISSTCFDKVKLEEKLECKSEDLNDLIKIASNLRIGNSDGTDKIDAYEQALTNRIKFYYDIQNKDDNDETELNKLEEIRGKLEIVRKLNKLFNNNFSELMNAYCKTRKGFFTKYDSSALSKLTSQLTNLFALFKDDNELTIKSLLNESVCGSISSEGALHITTLTGALIVPRKHVFICGLSSKYYPGKMQEDPFFFDSDLEVFGDKENILNSKNVFNNKKKQVKDLFDLASIMGNNIYLSYPRYDAKDYKNLNPSADIYEIYKKLNPSASYKNYIEAFVNKDYNVNIEYLSEKDKEITILPSTMKTKINLFNREYSPSALKDYISCPKKFYLNKIMNFNIDNEDDNNSIIAANDMGTLIHEQARLYMNRRFKDLDEFKMNSEEAFDLFSKGRIVGTKQEVESEKKKFMDMVDSLIELTKNYELIKTEEQLKGIYSTKITLEDSSTKDYQLKLQGRTDLICRDKLTNDIIIVDYKTGSSADYKNNDPISCIQGLIYASMYNTKNATGFDFLEANKCAFLFLKKNKVITCSNTEDSIKMIKTDVLDKLVLDLDNQSFITNETDDSCKYCKHKTYCGK